MASSAAGTTGWLRGKVKAVPSGDCLVIMAGSKDNKLPPEKTVTLASLVAPRLARRGGLDEPFAWDSREYLRKLCIGKEVIFKIDYSVPAIGREFGSVLLGDKNVASLVVSEGWAKVRDQGGQKAEASPYLAEFLSLEEQAKQRGCGRWSKDPGAAEASVRNLPPSSIGDSSNLDAMGLLDANKGRTLQGLVEQVRDGSTVRVYLLPEFHFVQVFIAGIQSPSMGRRAPLEPSAGESVVSEGQSSEVSGEALTSAQRLAFSTEVSPDSFGKEAKHFTELRVLNRDVRIVLEGVDKFSNLIGSVYYPDGDAAKDLALELVEAGLAKYVEWSANMMEVEARRRLKSSELEAKKNRLRMWVDYVPPSTNSKAIHDQNFAAQVIEVVSGDCIVVADDSVPYGSPLAERRVNLSSIRCPKMGNPRRDESPAPYAYEAKERLRTCLIGRRVSVSMEYSRKVEGNSDSRVIDFGSVFLLPADGSADQTGVNVAELLVGRGLASVVRHRDFEERSNHYDALLSAESRAVSSRKGIHSSKDPPVTHIKDLTSSSAKKAKDFLPFLLRSGRMQAVVEYVLSGHRLKLLIPKETCSIAFALSGVRCPGRGEPFSDEAISLMRRKIMQRDVEVLIETADRTGTFLGSLWESRTNCAVPLLEAGLAKLQQGRSFDRVADAHLLVRAEQSARKQRLKVWEKGGEETANGRGPEKETPEAVVVTEVLGGGRFYVQSAGDERVASIQTQLASLVARREDVETAESFSPKKGDIVLAQFSFDGSWNRAMVVNVPRAGSADDLFEVFYVDYGNQETVARERLRPADVSVASPPPLARLCSLAFVKVPSLEEDFGEEAAQFLSQVTLKDPPEELRASVEGRDASAPKVRGQGTGVVLSVTLARPHGATVNAAILKEGLGRLMKGSCWGSSEDGGDVLGELRKVQEAARRSRVGIWCYGDIESDDDEGARATRAPGGGRR